MRQVRTQELRELYHTAPPPPPDTSKKAQLMERAKQKHLTLPTETSMLQFIKSQIRFVNKSLFACQFLLLCLYGLFTTMILKDSDGFLLLVAAAPLVVLLGSGELSRSFRYHMTELELPSRFSLPQIFMARFAIAAVVDTLSLTCMLIMTAMKTYFTFGALILYGLVPSFLAASGSLFLLNRSRNANTHYCITAYCVGLSAFGLVSVSAFPDWYDSAAITVWMLILAISIGVFALELWKLFKDSAKRLECVSLK